MIISLNREVGHAIMLQRLGCKNMGGKMQNKVKTLLIVTATSAVVLSVLGLARYLNIGLYFAAYDSSKVTITLPNLTHLSTYLNGGVYQFDVRSVCLAGFLFLLTSWRALLIRHIRN